jgi:hypothetical protein
MRGEEWRDRSSGEDMLIEGQGGAGRNQDGERTEQEADASNARHWLSYPPPAPAPGISLR